MKLPEIDYNAPVQDISSGFAKMGEAQQAAASTFEQGLGAYGQELVKSQHYKAASTLLSGLDQAQIDLKTNKTISTQQLKDALGSDYENLPPEIKELTVNHAAGSGAQSVMLGDGSETDRNDIPMYSVAGAIFDSRAKKLLSESANHFTSPGWAAAFQDQAKHEVTTQKLALSKSMLKDMHEDLQVRDTQSAIDFANAGRPDLARQVVGDSRTMELSHKDELLSHIDKIEQTRPLYDHLRSGNIAGMLQDQKMLDDPNQLGKLSGEERLAFTNRIESEINKFQRQAKSADEDAMKRASEAGWNGIFAKERGIDPETGQQHDSALPVDYSDIPMPGTVLAKEQKEMIEYVDKINKGERPETDMHVYAGLTDLASKDRQKFSTTNLLQYRNKLSDTDFKHFLDLQMGAKGGNPENFDRFQSTDEAINTMLQDPRYAIDASEKQNKEVQKKVGYVKTLVQHELALEQEKNGGKPLSLFDRDQVIAKTLQNSIDPRGTFSGAKVLPREAEIPANMAAEFSQAAMRQNPSIMQGEDTDKKVKFLKDQYVDYQRYEPYVDRAWSIQRGKSATTRDAIIAWDRVKSEGKRYEGLLRGQGNWTQSDEVNAERMTNMAVQELLRMGR